MIAIVTLSVELLTGVVVAIVWKLRAICMHSQSFLVMAVYGFALARREHFRQNEEPDTESVPGQSSAVQFIRSSTGSS
jgi:hypothetical protein